MNGRSSDENMCEDDDEWIGERIWYCLYLKYIYKRKSFNIIIEFSCSIYLLYI